MKCEKFRSSSVKGEEYKKVSECSREHEEHRVKLANFIIPEVRVLLARQRRDSGISEDFPATYLVDDQAPNVDQLIIWP